jgi:formiminotetrahydrofolate cyclodeaminase
MKNLADDTFGDLLASLAEKSPAPGGGAAASMLGATAAALGGMVVAYSVGKKSLADHQQLLESARSTLTDTRARFLALADEDAAAYADLNRLQKLDTGDPERTEHEPAALRRAIDAPEAARVLAMDLLALLETLIGRTNPYLASDLAIAAVSAEAAAVAAGWNVRINAPGLPEADRDAFLARVEAGNDAAAEARGRVETACRGS